MKPLPLLTTLVTLAAVFGAILWKSRSSEPSPPALAPAPLPMDEDEKAEPVNYLSGPVTPAIGLINFVEEQLGLQFNSPPIFQAVSAIELIERQQAQIDAWPELDKMEDFARAMGWINDFTPLRDFLTALSVAEVRGMTSGDTHLLLHDFQADDRTEQAELVRLLARRLLHEQFSNKESPRSISDFLGQDYTLEVHAQAVENAFRAKHPPTTPSLHENLRESILVGLPAFFYELASYPEFQLLPHLNSPKPSPHLLNSPTPAYANHLLTLPAAGQSETQYELGPILFHILLYSSREPESVRPIASALLRDSLRESNGVWTWEWLLQNENRAKEAYEILTNALPEPNQPIKKFELDGATLRLIVSAHSLTSESEIPLTP